MNPLKKLFSNLHGTGALTKLTTPKTGQNLFTGHTATKGTNSKTTTPSFKSNMPVPVNTQISQRKGTEGSGALPRARAYSDLAPFLGKTGIGRQEADQSHYNLMPSLGKQPTKFNLMPSLAKYAQVKPFDGSPYGESPFKSPTEESASTSSSNITTDIKEPEVSTSNETPIQTESQPAAPEELTTSAESSPTTAPSIAPDEASIPTPPPPPPAPSPTTAAKTWKVSTPAQESAAKAEVAQPKESKLKPEGPNLAPTMMSDIEKMMQGRRAAIGGEEPNEPDIPDMTETPLETAKPEPSESKVVEKKKAEDTEKAQKIREQLKAQREKNTGGNLLSSIQAGIKLKKTEEQKPLPAKEKEANLGSALQKGFEKFQTSEPTPEPTPEEDDEWK